MRLPPPIHAHSLESGKLSHHLHSSCPFNATVTTMTMTANLLGPRTRLDIDCQLLDIYTHTYRSGSTRFKNARVVRMRLKSERGLRWVTFKVFSNGRLHLCGAYGTDVADFVVSNFVQELNRLYPSGEEPRYSYVLGDILLVNYRLTLGRRIKPSALAERVTAEGALSWVDPRETAAVIKILVAPNAWCSLRIFPTGAVAASVPNCGGVHEQTQALGRVGTFLGLLNS